jgi:glutamate racemase
MYSKQKPYNKIGFVDSGLGGLTVFKKVKKIMPNKEYIYFADSANVPYGSKTREQMLKISENIVRFFNEQQIDLLVVACNTLTSIALDYMKSIANFDIILDPLILKSNGFFVTKYFVSHIF